MVAVELKTLEATENLDCRTTPSTSHLPGFLMPTADNRRTGTQWFYRIGVVLFPHSSDGNALDQVSRDRPLTAVIQPGGARVGVAGKVLYVAKGNALRE